MTVSPLSLVFESGDSVKTVSITHNCTCPFTWSGSPVDTSGLLNAFFGEGDNTAVQVSINRSKVPTDTTIEKSWHVTSNGYGEDTIHVTIHN
jgi:hypothetical protein